MKNEIQNKIKYLKSINSDLQNAYNYASDKKIINNMYSALKGMLALTKQIYELETELIELNIVELKIKQLENEIK